MSTVKATGRKAPPPLERTRYPGIYKRAKGTGHVYVRVWTIRGKQVRRTFATQDEARAADAPTVKGERSQFDGRTAFKVYAAHWVENATGRTAKGLSESTRNSYRESMKLAQAFIGTTRLEAIDAPLIKEYIAHLADGHSPATVRRYYAPLRALLADATEDGLIKANPAAGVRVVVKDNREPDKIARSRAPKHLTAEQTRSLLDALHEEDRTLVWFLVATGLRISEALALRWRDAVLPDVGRATIAVPRDATKTDAGERTIKLTPQTATMLKARRTEDTDPEAPIFPTGIGTAMDAHNWRSRKFRPAAQAAGVAWATPHKLRHTLLTMMAAQGFGPDAIAAQAGHADGGVLALSTYVHSEAPDVDFMDGLLTAAG